MAVFGATEAGEMPESPHCPHLGLASDAASFRMRPSADHRCGRQAGWGPSEAHQRHYCLRGEYRYCPAYRGSGKAGSGARTFRPSALLRRRTAVIVTLAVLLTLAGVWGWRVKVLYDDLQAAQAALRVNAAQLDAEMLDLTPAELASLESNFADAAGRLRSVQDRLDGDPLLGIARHLPWFGGQIEAADRLVLVAADLAEAGIAGTRTLQDAPVDLESSEDASVHVLTLTREHAEDLRLVQGATDRALAAVESLRGESLIGPLDAARDEFVGYGADLRDLHAMASFGLIAPAALGEGSLQRYLVLGMNNGELMPGGGFIGNYAVLGLREGEIDSISSSNVYDLYDRWQERSPGAYVEPPRPLKTYLLGDEWSWAMGEAAWFPDYPTTARTAQHFLDLAGEGPVEGTIGLTVPAMEALLEVTGPIEVPELDTTFTADDVGLRLSFSVTHDAEGDRM
ncbi:MAG TPA: DUF4012 domain-containing protein, partial [Dehalococcoidia bacterium]|nr:DUF4012 domain-containing protein [Dehalococcoidia bacterium]